MVKFLKKKEKNTTQKEKFWTARSVGSMEGNRTKTTNRGAAEEERGGGGIITEDNNNNNNNGWFSKLLRVRSFSQSAKMNPMSFASSTTKQTEDEKAELHLPSEDDRMNIDSGFEIVHNTNNNRSFDNSNNNMNDQTSSLNGSSSLDEPTKLELPHRKEEEEEMFGGEEKSLPIQFSSTTPSSTFSSSTSSSSTSNSSIVPIMNQNLPTTNSTPSTSNSQQANISQLLDDYNLNFKLNGVDFSCAVCTDLIYRPVSSTCGHTFCKMCLEEALKHKPHCPICRDTISQLQHFKVNLLIEQILLLNFPQQYKERQLEATQATKNKKKIIIGNTHERVTTRTSNQHKWRFYVQIIDDTLGHGGKEVSPSKFIEKLEVFLHPSFTPSHIVLTKEPFEITRLGWGMFNINGKIHFKSHLRLTPLVFNHMLCFQGGKQMAIEIELPTELNESSLKLVS